MCAHVKYTLEYSINSSPKVLYNRLNTAGGLAEWFADDVNVRSGIYYFIWDGVEQKAVLLGRKEQKFVRFRWLDDESDQTYFEFKIEVDELTGDVALIITDFAEEDEQEDAISLWDSQITQLKHIIGN